eukprot:TRINITY_DN4993_c0_g1_i2.p1 TRINITY_DN4993_c0_g1~~TRINITY_DN4993_c0_g1_i2.p1  ORF type:complete len:518 (-),score=76.50 TRINITY_DN4993_c0_g1_i2:28-1581(-)
MNAVNDVVDSNETLSNIKEWIITNPKRALLLAVLAIAILVIIIIIIVVSVKDDNSTNSSPSPSLILSVSPIASRTHTISPSVINNATASPNASNSNSFSASPTPSPEVQLDLTVPSYNDPCNGHGMLYPESDDICECWDCYAGKNCESFVYDCVIDVSGGSSSLGLLEEYWITQHDRIPVVASAVDYRVSQQKDFSKLNPLSRSNSLSRTLAQLIISVHTKYGNVLNPERKQIIQGSGQTLFLASMYAYSQLQAANYDSVTLFARAPYYRGGAIICGMLKGYCTWNVSASLDPSSMTLIELVSVPSDPTGEEFGPVYTNNQNLVYDLTDYWPHLAQTLPLTKKNAPIMYFDLSKLSGHAGSRFGWALVSDNQIAYHMKNWIEATTVHESVDAAARAVPILRHLVSSEGIEFFNHTRSVMKDRWEEVVALFETKNYGNYTLDSEFGTSYLWVRCPLVLSEKECYSSFTEGSLTGYPGSEFGSVGAPYHYRLGLTIRSYLWSAFVERLENVLSGRTQKK